MHNHSCHCNLCGHESETHGTSSYLYQFMVSFHESLSVNVQSGVEVFLTCFFAPAFSSEPSRLGSTVSGCSVFLD